MPLGCGSFRLPTPRSIAAYAVYVRRGGLGAFEPSGEPVPGDATAWRAEGLNATGEALAFKLQAVGEAGPGALSAAMSVVWPGASSTPRPVRPAFGVLVAGARWWCLGLGERGSPQEQPPEGVVEMGASRGEVAFLDAPLEHLRLRGATLGKLYWGSTSGVGSCIEGRPGACSIRPE